MDEAEKKIIVTSTVSKPSKAPVQTNTDNSENEGLKQRILSEAKIQAEQIILEAKEQATLILKAEEDKINEWWLQKRADDEKLIAEAQKEGYQSGYEQGKTTAENDIYEQQKQIIINAQNILKEAYETKEQIIQESENVIVELATAISEKILRKELELDKSIIKNITLDLLKDINEMERISIYVNPKYSAYLQSAREELLRELNGQVELSIFPDPAIENGGVLIKTLYGTLDAKIDTQLEEIKALLLEIAGRRKE